MPVVFSMAHDRNQRNAAASSGIGHNREFFPVSDNKQKAVLGAKLRRSGWCALVALVVLAGLGIFSRSRSETRLLSWTAAQAIPSVTLISPRHGIEGQELVLPAEIEANYEAPIHARTGGYLKMWSHDIGAHVKAGELLAEIDTPDLDEQLLQARAALDLARADAQLADLTARRWKASVVANAVSQQAIDEKAGDAQARKAQVAARGGECPAVERARRFQASRRPVRRCCDRAQDGCRRANRGQR